MRSLPYTGISNLPIKNLVFFPNFKIPTRLNDKRVNGEDNDGRRW